MQKALIRLRFIVKENAPKKIKKDFEKTNNDLNKLTNILVQLDNKNLEFMLSNSLFIPLELISENENNVNFIHNILGLTHMKYNTNNIYDAYLEYTKIKTISK